MGKSPLIVNVRVYKKKKLGQQLILQKKRFVSCLAIHKCLNLFHNSPKGHISWNKERVKGKTNRYKTQTFIEINS